MNYISEIHTKKAYKAINTSGIINLIIYRNGKGTDWHPTMRYLLFDQINTHVGRFFCLQKYYRSIKYTTTKTTTLEIQEIVVSASLLN